MADLITVEQFTQRTKRDAGNEGSPERLELELLIADASALAADVIGDDTTVDAWDATAGTVPNGVVRVVSDMVRRGLDNPHGFVSESTFEYSYQLASATGVHATRAEARALRRAAGRSSFGAVPLGNPLSGSSSWLDGAL